MQNKNKYHWCRIVYVCVQVFCTCMYGMESDRTKNDQFVVKCVSCKCILSLWGGELKSSLGLMLWNRYTEQKLIGRKTNLYIDINIEIINRKAT